MKATQQARKPIATGLAAFRSRDDAQASRDAVGSRLQQTCAAAAAALYHDDATNIRAPWANLSGDGRRCSMPSPRFFGPSPMVTPKSIESRSWANSREFSGRHRGTEVNENGDANDQRSDGSRSP